MKNRPRAAMRAHDTARTADRRCLETLQCVASAESLQSLPVGCNQLKLPMSDLLRAQLVARETANQFEDRHRSCSHYLWHTGPRLLCQRSRRVRATEYHRD